MRISQIRSYFDLQKMTHLEFGAAGRRRFATRFLVSPQAETNQSAGFSATYFGWLATANFNSIPDVTWRETGVIYIRMPIIEFHSLALFCVSDRYPREVFDEFIWFGNIPVLNR